MDKEIGRVEGVCQIIRSKDGKYFGYGKNDEPSYEREWHDDPTKAIAWNMSLDTPTKVSCPTPMGLDTAELVKVKRTIIINELD